MATNNEKPFDWIRNEEVIDSKNQLWIISYRMKRKKFLLNLVDNFWIELFLKINENENAPKETSKIFVSSEEMYEEGNRIKDKILKRK